MKKNYEIPEIIVLVQNDSDVITTSAGAGADTPDVGFGSGFDW